MLRSDVSDLIQAARRVPTICNSPRYSPAGKAALVCELAETLALGLECIHADMPDAGIEPAQPPALHPAMSGAELQRLMWHGTTSPARSQALQQLAALPQFVATLAACPGVPAEKHEPVITGYIVSILEGLSCRN